MSKLTDIEMPAWMRERMMAGGVENGVYWVVAEGLGRIGQMNGYVLVPEASGWAGVPHQLIEGITAEGAHMDTDENGLSWDEDGWVGFAPQDKFDDAGKFFSVAKVTKMTKDLARQFAAATADAVVVERAKAWREWYVSDAHTMYDERQAFYAGFDAGRSK